MITKYHLGPPGDIVDKGITYLTALIHMSGSESSSVIVACNWSVRADFVDFRPVIINMDLHYYDPESDVK